MRKFGISPQKRSTIIWVVLISMLLWGGSISCRVFSQNIPKNLPSNIRSLLDTLAPLNYDRGERALLHVSGVGDLSNLSKKDAKEVIRELARRGVGVITYWKKGKARESSMKEGIRIARIQEELGLQVVVDATDLLYGFYDGTPSTAHVNTEGKAFYDSSYVRRVVGCPFTLHKRVPIIRSRVATYAEAYKAAGVDIDIVTADWEVDGPLEWNKAWAYAKRCVRGHHHIPNIQDFKAFQATIRSLRSTLLKETYTSPILQRFPKALISNYATYPNNGWRYWYDVFESPQPALSHRKDQRALYRPWYNEFTESGFTMAMPVVYTWYSMFPWYPEYSPDYRWFYNMLKVGSNAGRSTSSGIPIATFVHWHTTVPPPNPDPKVKQMSQQKYKELLWHLLLRGTDLFFCYSLSKQIASEMSLLQEVYNESLKYNAFFQWGRPITFKVPTQEKSVVSGLKLNNKILVRRTDFTDYKEPITLTVDGRKLIVPSKPGECQILMFEK